MADVARYDPFDVLEGVMKSVLRPGFDAAVERQRGAWSGTIPIDVSESDTSYTIWADLPGVRKEDVTVQILGNEVVLSADLKEERAVDQGQGKETMLYNERPTGTLSRRLQFPAEIDDAKAAAQYRDGVLMLTLPKKESAQVKRLAIH